MHNEEVCNYGTSNIPDQGIDLTGPTPRTHPGFDMEMIPEFNPLGKTPKTEWTQSSIPSTTFEAPEMPCLSMGTDGTPPHHHLGHRPRGYSLVSE